MLLDITMRYLKVCFFLIILSIVISIFALFLYVYQKKQSYPIKPPAMEESHRQADTVFVDKSSRKMQLMRDGQVIREYRIALGSNPVGHKRQEGDGRTPVGSYTIDWRNPNSIAHLSLHISYPNKHDQAYAKAQGVSPGGDIMIHGILNGWGFLGNLNSFWDWTNGCIAVTNKEMEEIWSLVPNGTPIIIQE